MKLSFGGGGGNKAGNSNPFSSILGSVGSSLGAEAGSMLLDNAFGKDPAKEASNMMNTLYPGTTPYERLSNGGGGAASAGATESAAFKQMQTQKSVAETQARTQEKVARIQTKSNERIATRSRAPMGDIGDNVWGHTKEFFDNPVKKVGKTFMNGWNAGKKMFDKIPTSVGRPKKPTKHNWEGWDEKPPRAIVERDR